MDLTMLPEHAALMRTILRVEPDSDLPEHLVSDYWRLKSAADRVRVTLSERDLVFLAMISLKELPCLPQEALLARARRGDLSHGQELEVRWKFGRWTRGWYHGATSEHFIVQLDDDSGTDRKIDPDRVRLPETLAVVA